MDNKKHICSWDDGDRGAYIDYCPVDKRWLLIVNKGTYENETTIYVPIKFCPFCGEKLE